MTLGYKQYHKMFDLAYTNKILHIFRHYTDNSPIIVLNPRQAKSRRANCETHVEYNVSEDTKLYVLDICKYFNVYPKSVIDFLKFSNKDFSQLGNQKV